MQANDFDELLRNRFEANMPEYNPGAWERLSSGLPVARSRHLLWPVILSIAASVSAIILIVYHSNAPYRSAFEVALQKRPSLRQVKQEQVRISDSNALHGSQGSSAAISDLQLHSKGTPASSQNHPPLPASFVSASDSQALPKEQAWHQHANTITEVFTGGRQVVNNESLVPKKGDRQPVLNPLVAKEMGNESKTTISFAGAVQYGNLYAGYAAGLNLHHKVGRRLFVEGEIGYLNYGAAETKQVSVSGYNTLLSPGPSIIGTTVEIQPHPVMQYVMASPIVGYQIASSISVGAGVDIQRALQGTEENSIQINDGAVSLLPLWDIGVSGRAEFGIAKRLVTGILYRQGVNNLVHGSSAYLDRRYVQVQVKIPLLRK